MANSAHLSELGTDTWGVQRTVWLAFRVASLGALVGVLDISPLCSCGGLGYLSGFFWVSHSWGLSHSGAVCGLITRWQRIPLSGSHSAFPQQAGCGSGLLSDKWVDIQICPHAMPVFLDL